MARRCLVRATLPRTRSLQFKLAVELRDDVLADQLHALHNFAVFETAELNPGQHLVHAHLAISAEQLNQIIWRSDRDDAVASSLFDVARDRGGSAGARLRRLFS